MNPNSNNNKNIFDNMPEGNEKEQLIAKREKQRRWKIINRFFDRIAGFIIVFVIIFGFTGLAFDYLCVKGPSESFRNFWLRTFSETRRFGFINNLFLSQEELDEIGVKIGSLENDVMIPTFDDSLITITEEKTDINGMDAYGLIDDDGDGIIFETINYKG